MSDLSRKIVVIEGSLALIQTSSVPSILYLGFKVSNGAQVLIAASGFVEFNNFVVTSSAMRIAGKVNECCLTSNGSVLSKINTVSSWKPDGAISLVFVNGDHVIIEFKNANLKLGTFKNGAEISKGCFEDLPYRAIEALILRSSLPEFNPKVEISTLEAAAAV